jgi:Rad3-related DNA helicase
MAQASLQEGEEEHFTTAEGEEELGEEDEVEVEDGAADPAARRGPAPAQPSRRSSRHPRAPIQALLPLPKLAGVPVYFPAGKKPFPQQLALMAKAIAAFKAGENALLESPTGTGKSLSLICSVLSYHVWDVTRQEELHRELREEEARLLAAFAAARPADAGESAAHPPAAGALRLDTFGYNAAQDTLSMRGCVPTPCSMKTEPAPAPAPSLTPAPAPAPTPALGAGDKRCASSQCCDSLDGAVNDAGAKRARLGPVSPKRILIASRTHSQISQLIGELKRCPDQLTRNLHMTVLASRGQTCINPKVRAKGAAQITDECRQLHDRDARVRCKWHPIDREVFSPDMIEDPVHDIEDLMDLANREGFCPYYAAKDLLQRANIVFAPYNYLLYPSVRRVMKLDSFLEGAIVVIDESHNLEDTCREAASFDVSEDEVHSAVSELRDYAEYQEWQKKAAAHELVSLLARLVEWMDATLVGDRPVRLEGDKALERLREARILDASTFGLYRTAFELLSNSAADDSGAGGGSAGGGASSRLVHSDEDEDPEAPSAMPGRARQLVDSLLTVFEFLLSEEGCFAQHFRLQLQVAEEEAGPAQKQKPVRNRLFGAPGDEGGDKSGGGRGKSKGPKQRIVLLGIWCMSPAVAFAPLAKLCRSVILTSGTLSPLDSFAAELGVPFQHVLSNTHVIDPARQLWAGVLPQGPGGVVLESSFASQSQNPGSRDALGLALAQLCRAVPDGALCFFPSYSFMRACVESWRDGERQGKVWDALCDAKSVILVEGSEREEGLTFDEQLAKFKSSVACGRGALYLCVFRGKLSEGIDFSDEMARAVFLAGIPFPSVSDLKILAKKEYQEMAVATASAAARQRRLAAAGDAGAGNAAQTEAHTAQVLSGNDWYRQQAFRALNQAVGRCIRHKNDYGAVVFLDRRFRDRALDKELSKWIRGQTKNLLSVQTAEQDLRAFFARMAAGSASAAASSTASAVTSEAAIVQAAIEPPAAETQLPCPHLTPTHEQQPLYEPRQHRHPLQHPPHTVQQRPRSHINIELDHTPSEDHGAADKDIDMGEPKMGAADLAVVQRGVEETMSTALICAASMTAPQRAVFARRLLDAVADWRL